MLPTLESFLRALTLRYSFPFKPFSPILLASAFPQRAIVYERTTRSSHVRQLCGEVQHQRQ